MGGADPEAVRETVRGDAAMAIEIERKFLVAGSAWRDEADAGVLLRQGYLTNSDPVSVRVRTEGEIDGTMTVKLPKSGLSRLEFEHDIARHEADTLMELCRGEVIEKVRYRVRRDDAIWEIDVYHGANRGLVVAEVELEREDQPFVRPEWLGAEVTGDERYNNSKLAEQPFSTWEPQATAESAAEL